MPKSLQYQPGLTKGFRCRALPQFHLQHPLWPRLPRWIANENSSPAPNTILGPSPTATVPQISLALNTVATSPSIAVVDEPAPVLVLSPTASLAKDCSKTDCCGWSFFTTTHCLLKPRNIQPKVWAHPRHRWLWPTALFQGRIKLWF